jgi:transcriptional regulator with XRE-family HTH domain
MADMDPATLNRLEQGKGNPNLKTIARVADALGVEVVELFPKAGSSSLEPSFNDVLADERRTAGVEVSEAYFVPLEEGEEPDTVTLRLYTVRLMDERDRLLQEVRRLEREKAAMHEELEKAERARE